MDDGPAIDESADESVSLVMFYGSGCPHCHAEREFLAELQVLWPDLTIVEYEVWDDAENL